MANILTEALIDLAFNPSEARDSKGRWTDALDRAISGDTAELEALVHADHGPSRITMPQLSGVPEPGSKAAKKFKPAPGQEVDLTNQFETELRKAGVSVEDTQVKISDLKPTQDELVASTVAGLAKFMLKAPKDSPVWEPIFVSADNHVIDGHHRWAARTVRSKIDGTPDETMAVRRIGLNIADALPVAVQFMDEWGLPTMGMVNHSTVSNFKPTTNLTADALADILLAHDVTHELRDEAGRWTDSPGLHVAHASKALAEDINRPFTKAKKTYGTVVPKAKANTKFPGEPSYAKVSEMEDWPSRDAKATDGTNPDGVRQQGLAQIHAQMWDSDEAWQGDDDEQYAASIWEFYQSPSKYGAINKALRTNKADPDMLIGVDQLRKDIALMFEKGGYTTTKPMKTYRALRSDKDHNWAKELQPGTVFEEDGLCSTTAHNLASQGWLTINPDNTGTGGKPRDVNPDDVVMEIQVPKGTRIVGGNTFFIETMLKPGSKFKVISTERRRTDKADMPLGGDHVAKPFYYTHVIAELQP